MSFTALLIWKASRVIAKGFIGTIFPQIMRNVWCRVLHCIIRPDAAFVEFD
jgi:hypothetical protein